MERSRERSQTGDFGCGIICLARACGAFSAISKLNNCLCVSLCVRCGNKRLALNSDIEFITNGV